MPPMTIKRTVVSCVAAASLVLSMVPATALADDVESGFTPPAAEEQGASSPEGTAPESAPVEGETASGEGEASATEPDSSAPSNENTPAAQETPASEQAASRTAGAGELLTLAQYEQKLEAYAAASGKTAEDLALDPEYVHILLQRRLVKEVGYDTLSAKAASDPQFNEMLTWLLGDYEMLGYYIYGGPPEANDGTSSHRLPTVDNWMKSLSTLSDLYAVHKSDVTDTAPVSDALAQTLDAQASDAQAIATDAAQAATDDDAQAEPAAESAKATVNVSTASLCKRMMAADALCYGVDIYTWRDRHPPASINYKWKIYSDPVKKYEIFKRFYEAGLLVDIFDELNVGELRMVFTVPLGEDELQWTNYYYHVARWGNTDYATNPKVFSTSPLPQAVGGMFPYAAIDTRPKKYGGIGDKFYDTANWNQWNDKYHLEVHDSSGLYDYKVLYGYNDQGEVYGPVWPTIETGGVCVDISFTSQVGFNALGIPCSVVYQPGHASFLTFSRSANGKISWGQGYDIFGMHQSGTKIMGESYLPAGWGDLPWAGFYNAVYAIIGDDAMHNSYDGSTNFEQAENLCMMAEIKMDASDAAAAEGLFEKAIAAQLINLTAWDGLARAYELAGKGEGEWYALAERASATLKWYPMSMSDYLTAVILPHIESSALRADLVSLAWNTLNDAASNADASGMHEPHHVRNLANYHKDNLPKIATFFFDTGAITLHETWAAAGGALELSYDGGATWESKAFSAGQAVIELTAEEQAKLTDEHDLRYRIAGQRDGVWNLIEIKGASAPQSNSNVNTPDDNEDSFINLQNGLEYSLDDGATWQPLGAGSKFEDDVNVLIRRKATGTTLASPSITVAFTKGEGTPERSYIKREAVTLVDPKPESMKNIEQAFDGNVNTYWENKYTVAIKQENGAWVPDHNIEIVTELAEPRFVSAMSYLPAAPESAIRGCEVYASTDGVTWQLAGSTSTWEANKNEKALDFDRPVYAKYIKIRTTKIGVKQFMGIDCGSVTAAEFKFYENFAVKSKEVAGLALDTAGVRTDYQVGDKFDPTGMNARIAYADGTESVIPLSELSFDADVFDSVDTHQVTASYQGHSATIDVTVRANDRVATQVASVTAADGRYYAGDAVDPAKVSVCVSDGAQSWYLLPGEFTVEGTLVEGANSLTVRFGDLTAAVDITALKTPQSVSATTPEGFKTRYTLGETIDFAGVAVSLTNADGTVEELVADGYDVSIVLADGTTAPLEDFSKTAGSKKIRFSLKDKGDVCCDVDVTVLPYLEHGAFRFEAVDGKTELVLTSYEPEAGYEGFTVVIPGSVSYGGVDYAVTKIGDAAFSGATGMTSVEIPATVGHVAAGAFATCASLKSVFMTEHADLSSFVCEEGAFAPVEGGLVYLRAELSGTASPIPGYQVASIAQSAVDMLLVPPSKTSYVLGESIDVNDMSVMAVLANGMQVPVEDYALSGFDSSRTGQQTVTVQLNGTSFSKTFDVTVDFPTVSFAVQPQHAAYLQGEAMAALTVQAAAQGGATVSYQWYEGATGDGSDAAIAGAMGSEYLPTKAGSYYAAAYLEDAAGVKSAPAYSRVAKVAVGDFVAIADGVGYDSLKTAVESTAGDAEVRLCKDAYLSSSVLVEGKKRVTIAGGGAIVTGGRETGDFFKVTGGAELVLRDVTVDGSIVWTGDIDPVLKRGTINSKGVYMNGTLVYVGTGSRATLAAGSVLRNNHNYGTHGGGAYIQGGSLVVEGGVIKDNFARQQGAGVYLTGGSSFTMTDGVIEGNFSRSGHTAAVYADGKSHLSIQGGTIRNNKGLDAGGGIRLRDASLEFLGGSVESNYAKNGAALYVDSGSTVFMKGGSMTGNCAEANGGAVYMNGSLSVSDMTFDANTAKLGGAIWTNGDFTMNALTFTGNAADAGDGIYMDNAAGDLRVWSVGTAQEVYLKDLTRLIVQGNLGDAHLPLASDAAVTDATDIGQFMGDFTANGVTLGNRELARVSTATGFALRMTGWYRDVAEYRSGSSYKAPAAPAGMVFAGWYTTDDPAAMGPATALPANAAGGRAYAKFVEEGLLSVKRQVTSGATADSGKVDLRLLASVDSLDFASVGFVVARDGGAPSKKQTKTVYEAVESGYGNGVVVNTPSEIFGTESARYFIAYAYRNIPQDRYDTVMTVTPFWVTLDGTEVSGATREFTIREAVDAGQVAYDQGV